MARRIALLLTLASWNCAQAQIAPEPPVTVPAFTRVEVRLEEPISSNTNHTGDRFKLTITNDVYIDDFLAIPAGSEGEGEVVHASKAGFGGKQGELILAARFVNVGESRIPLRSLRLNATGKGHFDEALVMTMLVPKVSGFFIEGGEYRRAERDARGSGDRRRRAAAAKRERGHGECSFARRNLRASEPATRSARTTGSSGNCPGLPTSPSRCRRAHTTTGLSTKGRTSSRSMSNLVRPTTSAANSRWVCLTAHPNLTTLGQSNV